MIIKYNSVFINGVDMTGRVADLPEPEALRLVGQGYAVREDAPADPEEPPAEPRRRKFGR
jgi:hypothetical protein